MRQVTRSTVLLFVLVISLTAGAGEGNETWQDIGTVSSWMDMDSRLFRVLDGNPNQDVSQFNLNQVKAYGESKTRDASLPEPVSLGQFQTLGSEEKSIRRKLALKELEQVVGFYLVQVQRLQRAKENLPTDGINTSGDITALTDCLRHLGHAVGLDPENYYAWHLQSYFAACCGDVKRSHDSLLAAAKGLNSVPPDELINMKQRVMLDLAWLERNLGLFQKALGRLDVVLRMGTEPVEAKLLRGLIAAQTGDEQVALLLASELRSQPVSIFPVAIYSISARPELVDVTNWKTQKSAYLKSWITALLEMQKGDFEAAGLAFPEVSTYRYYPYAHQFWNDAGLIFERTDRGKQAGEAWAMARISRPWINHMVYKPYGIRLGELTGNSKPSDFILGFDSFYVAGSRLAYGASLVGKMSSLTGLEEKQVAATRALDQLEICQRSGQYPGQASILQGHVYFLLDDFGGSLAELKQAQVFFEKEGDAAGLVSVQKDLEIMEQNLNAVGVKEFFSQSGRSQGRWEADLDPATTEKELVARLEKDTSDDAARLELARLNIRHGKVEQGRQLAFNLYNPNRIDDRTKEVVTLVLEADRILGKEDMADVMLRQLGKGRAGRWDDPGLWSLVSAICQDHGRNVDAKKALEMASKLDPDNQGIRNQLRILE